VQDKPRYEAHSISVLQNMMRVEFANINRRLTDIDSKMEKLSSRCDRIPVIFNDLTACRRELADVREAVDNLAAAGSRGEMDVTAQLSTSEEHRPGSQWPQLPIASDEDWDLAVALVTTEDSLPQSKSLFCNYLASRIRAQAKNAKAPVKAAIRCVIDEKWATQRMSMLGWRLVEGKKTVGFKAFSDLRPFVIST
jgi:hypothetical protein